jgi:hypothetical protein
VEGSAGGPGAQRGVRLRRGAHQRTDGADTAAAGGGAEAWRRPGRTGALGSRGVAVRKPGPRRAEARWGRCGSRAGARGTPVGAVRKPGPGRAEGARAPPEPRDHLLSRLRRPRMLVTLRG